MQSTTAMEKTVLRVNIRKILNDMPSSQMQKSDAALFANLVALPQIAQAHIISLFWGITGLEPDTSRLVPQLLDMGKVVCLPRMLPERRMELRQYTPGCPMDMNSFGISEPTIDCPLVEKKDIDLVIVPALCYGRKGYRLGYGGGYYDRWLADYTGVTVGMCRDAVLQDSVPAEEHDKPVQVVVTESQILQFS